MTIKHESSFIANPLIVIQPRPKRVLANGDTVEAASTTSPRVWARVDNNRTVPRKDNKIFNDKNLATYLMPYTQAQKIEQGIIDGKNPPEPVTPEPVEPDAIEVTAIEASWFTNFDNNDATALDVLLPASTPTPIDGTVYMSVDGGTPLLSDLAVFAYPDGAGISIGYNTGDKLPNATTITFTYKDVDGNDYITVVDASTILDYTGGGTLPINEPGEFTYEYYINNPTAYARLVIQLFQPLKEGTEVKVIEPDRDYIATEQIFVGLDGFTLQATFVTGDDQYLREFDKPFYLEFTLEDGRVITRSSENAEQIYN